MRVKFLLFIPALIFAFGFESDKSSITLATLDGSEEKVELEKGYLVYKEKIGNLSFPRANKGELICDAAIVDLNALTQGVKHLSKVASGLKNGRYGNGSRSTVTQLKRIRTGVDAEISYTARITNARIGDSLSIDVGGETVAEIRSETEGDIVATFFITSMGKGKDESKLLTNKEFVGGQETFNLRDKLGVVVPGSNDYVSFTYLPKHENNVNNPTETVKFKLLRYERLKTTIR